MKTLAAVCLSIAVLWVFTSRLSEEVISASDPRVSLAGSVRLLDGQPFTGTLVRRFPNGNLWRQSSYRQGLKDGVHLTWYSNGRLATRRPYQRGQKVGLHVGWYPNGQRRFQSYFEDGLYEGPQREWYDDGNLFWVAEFSAGKEVSHKRWRRSGQIYANYVWRGGRLYGLKGDEACFKTKDGRIENN